MSQRREAAPSAEGGGQRSAWNDALRVAALLAADPHGCGGVVLKAGAGPVRERWLEILRAALPEQAPFRRMPANIADDRLLGGLDLAATLRAGRPVAQSGLLAEADGGIVVVPMAERLSAGIVARLCAALDSGTVALARDGLQIAAPARIALVLLDEGGEDEGVADALADRLAFRIDLSSVALRDTTSASDLHLPRHRTRSATAAFRFGNAEGALQPTSSSLEAAFEAAVTGSQDASLEEPASDPVAVLCVAADDLGIASLRGPLLAVKVARRLARLDDRDATADADVVEAARLVLAPRATRLPQGDPPPTQPEEGGDQADPSEPEQPPPSAEDDSEGPRESDRALDEIVLEAARAAIPPNLLAQLLAGGPRLRSGKAGRMGASGAAPRSGRPAGSRPGDPRRGQLDLIATLRAAAPWQRLRRGSNDRYPASEDEGSEGTRKTAPQRRVIILPDDLRIRKLVQRTETTTIFCVDASGSAAMERLAEAKGAVELLLAESYVRRDRVALVAFRGVGADLVLPPTRSLVRAKRALAGLPGGGGTPLAAGLDAAATLALGVRRGGGSPVVVLLTDGRANVARSGEGGRARASEEALAAGRALRTLDIPVLLIDTGTRPEGARRLADAAQARYIPLPYADASGVSAAVRASLR